MSDVEQQINRWLSSSRTYLNEAKVIGLNTNGILRKFKELLDGNNLLILKITYMIEFLRDQIKLMSRIFQHLQGFNKRYQLKLLKNLNYLSNLISQLNQQLTSLNSITIDSSIKTFVCRNSDLKKKDQINSLYDYLSLEEFLKIQQNYEILSENFENLNTYLVNNQLSFFEINLLSFDSIFNNVLQEFNNINSYFYKDLVELNLYSNDNNNTTLTCNEKFSILINYYELEMASLIHSLTNHYDQCREALQLYNHQQHAPLTELLQVLAGDSHEAPNVLSDLKLVFLKIEKLNNKSNLQHLNAALNRIYEELIINNFVVNDFLQKTNKNLKIEDTAKKLQKLDFNFLKTKYVPNTEKSHQPDNTNDVVNLDMLQNIEMVLKILQFLTNFETGYFNLILEIDRNQQVNVKIRKLISNFLAKLNTIEAQNSLLNNTAIKDLQLYLPSDLSSIVARNRKTPKSANNKHDSLPLVEIVSEFAEYPELDQSLVQFAKLRLNKLKENTS